MEKREIIIISRCLNYNSRTHCYIFHFKGYFKGERVEKIHGVSPILLKKAEEYIFKFEVIDIKEKILIGKIKKIKKLSELYF